MLRTAMRLEKIILKKIKISKIVISAITCKIQLNNNFKIKIQIETMKKLIQNIFKQLIKIKITIKIKQIQINSQK